ncbi:putative helicase Mov10l1 [Hypsibius exemplaris]|uniref:Helicase Mov10l1 n=1 Tax=Hypsibius exemplaris TaxID=2072580 RepID=A0A9X6NJX5_HYPEX|nr:putative helicase Mov10l1 [Hypsibius exemplaris]
MTSQPRARRVSSKLPTSLGNAPLPTNRKHYDIEGTLLQLLNRCQDPGTVIPFLRTVATPQNLVARLHHLLWLEEHHVRITDGAMVQSSATVTKVTDFSFKFECQAANVKLRKGDRLVLESTATGAVWDAVVEGSKVHVKEMRVLGGGEFVPFEFSKTFHIRRVPDRHWFRHLHAAVDAVWSNLGAGVAFGVAKLQPSRKLPPSAMDTGKLEFFDGSLDDVQKGAIRNVVSSGGSLAPYIILGSAGTGKTRIIQELLLQFSANCTWSRVLVVGLTVRATCRLVEFYAAHPVAKTVPFALLVADGSARAHVSDFLRDSVWTVDALTTRELGPRVVFTADVYNAAYIIENKGCHFTHLLLDDSASMTEPEAMMAMACLEQQSRCPTALTNLHIVLTGDLSSLAPDVRSPTALKYGLGNSMIYRLLGLPLYGDSRAGRDGLFVTELKINYRSVPAIVALTGMLLCNYRSDGDAMRMEPAMLGRQRADSIPETSASSSKSPQNDPGKVEEPTKKSESRFAPDPKKEAMSKKSLTAISGSTVVPASDRLLQFPAKLPTVQFTAVRGMVKYLDNDQDPSKAYNEAEIVVVLDYLQHAYQAGIPPDQVCVFTPGRGQAMKIAEAIRADGLPMPAVPVSFDLVGHEWDVMIISCLRSATARGNLAGQGFNAHPELSNLAVTRGRDHLLVVGNDRELAQEDDFWRLFLRLTRAEKGCLVGTLS